MMGPQSECDADNSQYSERHDGTGPQRIVHYKCNTHGTERADNS
jgi:hypothetical protein